MKTGRDAVLDGRHLIDRASEWTANVVIPIGRPWRVEFTPRGPVAVAVDAPGHPNYLEQRVGDETA